MIYVTHDQAEAMTLADRLVVLDCGVVQQVDRPLAVYRQPRNRFVAGFLGWPAMNLIDGRLVEADRSLRFEAPGIRVAVPTTERWKAHAGRDVTLGVRPEDVRPVRSGETGLAMRVALVEPLGPECVATLERDGLRLTARLDEKAGIEHQQTIEVCFNMEHAHLFDLESGVALNLGRPAG
jgi:multiple sugar transport system ATP-binding protein